MNTKMFKHLMIDIESLGKTPDSVILSIGAVPFNMDGTIGKPLELFPIVESQQKNRKIQWSTIQWWFDQSANARKQISSVERFNDLKECLIMLKDWSSQQSWNQVPVSRLDPDFKVWSHGASFDIAMLNYAYAQCSLETPWFFRNQFDTRTMLYMSKLKTINYPNKGVRHNAVNDCKWQISWLVDAHKILH